VPDGPDRKWNEGKLERIEAQNRRSLEQYFDRLSRGAIFQRHTPPLNVIGGYKFPGAPELYLQPLNSHAPARISTDVIPDDLTIPAFLVRA
jgi:hypothetical protein